MMCCDICGKTGVHLEQFREPYQTDDIKESCTECVKIVNDHIWKIRAMNNKIEKYFTLQFIQNMKERLFKKTIGKEW